MGFLLLAVLFGLVAYGQYTTNKQVKLLEQAVFAVTPTPTVEPTVTATPSAVLTPTKAVYKFVPVVKTVVPVK